MGKRVLIFPAEKAPQEYMFGIVLFVVAVGMFVAEYYLNALLLTIVGFGMLLTRHGYLVDFDKLRWTSYYTVFSYQKVNEYKFLWNLDYISIVRMKEKRPMSVESIQRVSHSLVYRLNFVEPKRSLVRIMVGSEEDVRDLAWVIAKAANLKIYDVTTPEKKWIDPNE